MKKTQVEREGVLSEETMQLVQKLWKDPKKKN